METEVEGCVRNGGFNCKITIEVRYFLEEAATSGTEVKVELYLVETS